MALWACGDASGTFLGRLCTFGERSGNDRETFQRDDNPIISV